MGDLPPNNSPEPTPVGAFIVRLIAILGIAWAIWAPCDLLFENLRGEQQRYLLNLAGLMESTNEFNLVIINRTNFANHVYDMARMEGERNASSNRFFAVSSAFIIILSVCTYELLRKRHGKAT